MTTIHLVVARCSNWDQWAPVKGFAVEEDAETFVRACVAANKKERQFFDDMLELRLPEVVWEALMKAYEAIRQQHPAPYFRDYGTEFRVQPLEVVGSAQRRKCCQERNASHEDQAQRKHSAEVRLVE